MTTVYVPKGKAREYSPFALNIYEGCDHGCFYCYVPSIKSAFDRNYIHENVKLRSGILQSLKSDLKKFQYSEQVLLSFTGDVFCNNQNIEVNKSVLNLLFENKISTAILTKGGLRAIPYFDIISKFGKNIKIGATLTFDNDKHSLQYEIGASPTSERIQMLEYYFNKGVQTWVSVEPVLNHKQSINLIKNTLHCVSHYKVGKINHNKEIENKINWNEFLIEAVEILRNAKKPFYIKEDLRNFANGFYLSPEEIDMDFLNVPKFEKLKTELF